MTDGKACRKGGIPALQTVHCIQEWRFLLQVRTGRCVQSNLTMHKHYQIDNGHHRKSAIPLELSLDYIRALICSPVIPSERCGRRSDWAIHARFFLKKPISPLVEESWVWTSESSCSSGSIFFASCLPSSTLRTDHSILLDCSSLKDSSIAYPTAPSLPFYYSLWTLERVRYWGF